MSDVSQNSETVMDDEIDLKELFTVLWDGKLIISAIKGISDAIKLTIAFSMPKMFTARSYIRFYERRFLEFHEHRLLYRLKRNYPKENSVFGN